MAEQLSDRDDLAAIIRAQLWNTDDDGPPVYHSKRWAAVADAILAAGWVRVTSAYLDPDVAADELRAVRLEQWLDRLAPSLFTATVCTHEFDGAICDVCWDNTQRVCRIIQRALLVGDIEQAHLTATMPLDGCWVCYDWTWPCDDCLRGRRSAPPEDPRRPGDSRSDDMERAHADADPRASGRNADAARRALNPIVADQIEAARRASAEWVDRPRRKLRVGSVWERLAGPGRRYDRYVWTGRTFVCPSGDHYARETRDLDTNPELWREVPVEELEREAR